jgi:hypothetical protein
MGKIKIKKSELDRIIKEEALKFRKAISLKKEIASIEKELKQLTEGTIDEVEAGEMHKISSDTGFEGKQAKPKFHNPAKNPNTMMEDGSEDIEDVDMDVDSDEDMNSDKIDKAAVLSAIEDLKMALHLHGAGEEDMEGAEGEEGMEDGAEGEEGMEGAEGEEGAKEANSEEDEEGDEIFEFEEEGKKEHAGAKVDGQPTEEGSVKEGLDEPIEGGSVVQVAKGDDINDNMKKDSHVKEAGDTLMESEKRRMAVLAGIMKG